MSSSSDVSDLRSVCRTISAVDRAFRAERSSPFAVEIEDVEVGAHIKESGSAGAISSSLS